MLKTLGIQNKLVTFVKVVRFCYFALCEQTLCIYIYSFIIFRDSDDDSQDNASDVSDIEVLPPSKPVITSTNEKEDMDEDANVQLTSHDWSFLSAIFPDQANIL